MNLHMVVMQAVKRPELNKEISDLEWDSFVYLRKSLRGKHLELMASYFRM